MLKKFKNASMYLVLMACVLAAFTGCAAPAADYPANTAPAVTATAPAGAPSATDAPEVSDPVVTDAPEASASAATDAPGTMAPAETVPAATGSDAPGTTVPAETAPATTASQQPAVDMDRYMRDPAYADEVFATGQLSEVAGLQSKPERDNIYCVVDMRKDHNAYDVDWDYGSDYEDYAHMADWSKVFDAKYYMDTFPMLALQYHYDEDQLLRHFQTVGVHEGRQGRESFNVGAFMDWCDVNLPYTKDAFQGDYALYYLFYAAARQELPASFPAAGRPMQYRAVLTKAQQVEFDGVNSYRAKAGLEPYVYDSELAAFANFRAWVNQDEALTGHEWVTSGENQDIIDLYFAGTKAGRLSENLIETANLFPRQWYKTYATSESHYNAMVSSTYHYFGASNLYVDSVTYKTSSNRGVQFDIFTDTLSTAVNP